MFLRFLSLTTASQVCLMINQLVLLPLEVRNWGTEQTAQWFVVQAFGNLASIADLGLRNAGHAQLLSSVGGDRAAERDFRQVWAMTRLVMLLLTGALLVAQIVFSVEGDRPIRLWVGAVTIALALDTLVIVRGVWFDTLGHFNRVEALFLGMAASRILFSIVALLAFNASPAVLGWIMLTTASTGLCAQALLLHSPSSLALSARIWLPGLWRSLAIVRYVVAEPASNWVRLSLPVIVLATMEPPRFVTIYVALRAIFGLARQVGNQVGRYASVRYVQLLPGTAVAAEQVAVRAMLMVTLSSLAMGCATLADHGRLLSLWLHVTATRTETAIALSFAVGAAAYGYQIFAGIMIRSGLVVQVARRQYIYLIASFTMAAVGYMTGDTYFYLSMLALQELLIASLFVALLGHRSILAATAAILLSAGLIGLLWIFITVFNPFGWFDTMDLASVSGSMAAAGLPVIAALVAFAGLDTVLFPQAVGWRGLWKPRRRLLT